jgi:ABC-type nitrate/sulfonate/bicarbonate transport system substrate-binding protein
VDLDGLAIGILSAILFLATALPRAIFAAAAPITVRVGYPQPSGAQLPLWLMSEAKLDKKYGFDLKIFISPAAPG